MEENKEKMTFVTKNLPVNNEVVPNQVTPESINNIPNIQATPITPVEQTAPVVPNQVAPESFQNNINIPNIQATPIAPVEQTAPVVPNQVAPESFQNNINIPNLQPVTNIIPTEYNLGSTVNDEELLSIFIGNNYEKITTKKFNFAGFFFGTLYMYYRKMFLYALLTYILSLLLVNLVSPLTIIVINVLVGAFVNKIYVAFAKKKIMKIKFKNQGKSYEELKQICQKKGGTSIGQVFLGLLITIVIAIIACIILLINGAISGINNLFESFGLTEETEEIDSNATSSSLENIDIDGYMCSGNTCIVMVANDEDSTTNYTLKIDDNEYFINLLDYDEYLKIDVDCQETTSKKYITGYKITLKDTDEDISSVTDIDELRKKIGLLASGTYTEKLKLIDSTEMISTTYEDDVEKTTTYKIYYFENSSNVEYEIYDLNQESNLNLVDGTEYNVTFEVVNEDNNYKNIIKSVE